MHDSEALAFVAVLQAAFPSFTGGEPTARLFATKLAHYDATDAAAGINALVETREDTAWPSWAEVARWIRESKPKPIELIEADPPADPELAQIWTSRIGRIVGRQTQRMAMPRVHESSAEIEAKILRARRALKDLEAS